MLRSIFTSTFLIVVILAGFAEAQTGRQLIQTGGDGQKRIALVIGNGAYQHAGTLPNPSNDATAVAKALRGLGFEVIGGEKDGINLTQERMESLIVEFGARLAATKGVGLFYYAGHGVQSGGVNYLIPVDADIPDESRIKYKAVSLGYVLDEMATARNDFNLVILDACRNNPFARSWRSNRDIGDNKGLVNSNPPRGTLVLYATEPGSVSSDGAGSNSPFTTAFLKQINTPNLELDPLIKAVARDVQTATKQKQSPWKEGLYSGDFYFKLTTQSETTVTSQIVSVPKPTPLPTPTPVAAIQGINVEESYWQIISNSNTQSGYENYLAEYPKGKHATEANDRIGKFKQDEIERQKAVERSKWHEAERLNTTESYNSYLAAFPKGEFATSARSGLKEIETKADQTKWDEVQLLNRKSAFQSYLSAYPNGKYTANARQKINDFDDEEARIIKEQQKATDLAKWQEAEQLKTIAGYDAYLAAYPKGDYASLARLRLDGLGKKATATNAASSKPPDTTAEPNKGITPAPDAEIAIIELEDSLTYGSIKIELYSKIAPKMVQRFKELARDGTYSRVTFHRVNNSVVQSGDPRTKDSDPLNDGMGKSTRPDLPAEFSDVPFEDGIVGAARNMNVNSANSQFFIMLKRERGLDTHFTVFGKVIEGMNNLRIMAVQPNQGERPTNPIRIKRIMIVQQNP